MAIPTIWTEAMLLDFLTTPREPKNFFASPFLDMLEDARKNPTPHVVTYIGDEFHYAVVTYIGDEFHYASPKEFLWLPLHAVSPSACEWIVPGTLWDTSDL